jgi:hypothetical protein
METDYGHIEIIWKMAGHAGAESRMLRLCLCLENSKVIGVEDEHNRLVMPTHSAARFPAQPKNFQELRHIAHGTSDLPDPTGVLFPSDLLSVLAFPRQEPLGLIPASGS